jgi:amidase
MDPFASALEVARDIRQKKVSPVEVVDFYLDRIERLNPELNAVTWRRDDDVRREARAAEDALMRGEGEGPFFGVPLPIKDLAFVEGWPISFGSKAFLGHVAGFDSTVVERFRKAGFLLLCRTNTPEFGILPVTENDAWGVTRNPWNNDHTPGGSSGGAGAAVAAGFAPMAHASDGGGSIRIPASCCGLVGLKPSRGRGSMGPLLTEVMHGFVSEGCVAHTVADTAALYDAIGAPDPTAWSNAPALERPLIEEVGVVPGRLRVAYLTSAPTGAGVSSECVAAVEKTAALLQDLGHEVFEGAPDWPDPEHATEPFMTVWNTGMAYWGVEDLSAVEPLSRAMAERAAQVDSLAYVKSVAGLQIFTRQIVRAWGERFDVLVTPTLAVEPPRVGALFEGAGDDPMMPLRRAADMAAFTPLINATGQPAISLPLHVSAAGLPVGVQLVGKPWGEGELIRLASQIEQAAPWRDRRPAGMA